MSGEAAVPVGDSFQSRSREELSDARRESKRGVHRLCETKKTHRAAISGSNGDTRTMTGEETETEGSLWSVRGEAKKMAIIRRAVRR